MQIKVEFCNYNLLQFFSILQNGSGSQENLENGANTTLLVERNNLSIRVTDLEKQLGSMQLESGVHNQEAKKLEEENSSLKEQMKVSICYNSLNETPIKQTTLYTSNNRITRTFTVPFSMKGYLLIEQYFFLIEVQDFYFTVGA